MKSACIHFETNFFILDPLLSGYFSVQFSCLHFPELSVPEINSFQLPPAIMDINTRLPTLRRLSTAFFPSGYKSQTLWTFFLIYSVNRPVATAPGEFLFTLIKEQDSFRYSVLRRYGVAHGPITGPVKYLKRMGNF